MSFIKIPDTLILKADYVLGIFTVYTNEPNQEVYFSKDISFIVEPILNNTAIYCVQQVGDNNAGAVIVGEDETFLVSGHTRKGKKYLIDRWLSGERTAETFLFS